MKSIGKWGIRNPVPVNLVMLLILLLGLGAAGMLRREMFPEFKLDLIHVVVTTETSSTPEQVDRNIIQVIQPRIQNIQGIKEIKATARESAGSFLIEVRAGEDVQLVKEDIVDEIGAITTLPDNARDPKVVVIKASGPAAILSIYGEHATELQLREVADQVVQDMKSQGIASRVNVMGARPLELAIQLPLATLKAKGLTVRQVAEQIRAYDVELTAGEVRSSQADIVIKGDGRRVTPEQLRRIPIHFPNGEAISLGDLVGRHAIDDGFVEYQVISEFNGQPAQSIMVERAENEDIIDLCNGIREHIKTLDLPYHLNIEMGVDMSEFVRDRLQLITKNGLTGLILVLIVLSLFLEWRVAFWAASGIAFSLIGTLAIMYVTGSTINMMSLFAFLITTGIVVDDAIVVGESFFAKRQDGMGAEEAADAALDEVSTPVTGMMLTTVIAFTPLLFVAGIMGKFIAVIPAAVISALSLSLFESLIILPAHLAHHCGKKETGLMRFVHLLLFPFIYITSLAQPFVNRGLDFLLKRGLIPLVRQAVHHRYATAVLFTTLLIFLIGMIPAGLVRAEVFSNPDSEFHEASVEFGAGTPFARTEAAMRQFETALIETGEFFAMRDGQNPLKDYYLDVGGSSQAKGSFSIQLASAEDGRKVSGQQFLDTWRKNMPIIPDLLSFEFSSAGGGPDARDIEVQLSSSNDVQLKEADRETLAYLKQLEGVVDISSTNSPGAPTYSIVLRDEFRNLPITEMELIQTLQQIYYGVKVDTFYRGDNDIALMVRSAPEDRSSLAELRNMELPSGLRVGQVAEIKLADDPVEIRRVDGLRTVKVGAAIDRSAGANGVELRAKIESDFLSTLPAKYPDVKVVQAGEAKEGNEAIASMLRGFVPAMFVIYLILGGMFRSYTQPLIIMQAIPFGLIGAIVGHWVMGLSVNLLSGFGLIALTGIAVNDSLVLIDYINVLIRQGVSLKEAVILGVERRFRPILLTSVTTVAGLCPILFETSFHAQFLIPMVTSITFGVAFATLLILILIPVAYVILLDFSHIVTWVLTGKNPTREEFVLGS